MVLISNHYITTHFVDVIVHTYNILETIRDAQETNWSCACVMVRFDLNPPWVDQWRPNSAQIVTN